MNTSMRANPWVRAGVRLLAVGVFLLLLGLLFVRFIVFRNVADNSAYDRSTKINLALRRTAHQLLRAAGDSTSQIPAVDQPNDRTFRVVLGRAFNYDRLPNLLQESLRLHQLTDTYDVAVLDCERGDLQLGYSVIDLLNNKSITCGGRSMTAGCYTLQVTFAPSAPPEPPGLPWSFYVLNGLLASILALVWYWSRPVHVPEKKPASPLATQLHFGKSSFDEDQFTLTSGPNTHKLTYREAKLLRLLASHPNQVLERDQILKLVWEDEGITVGRSVDVFISRLRKLLAADPTVRIAAVHGVGYRLEVEK